LIPPPRPGGGKRRIDMRAVMQIPAHCGQPFRRIADSVPVIADSF
jgi:hypothetical protein